MILHIVVLIVIGLIVGALGRLIVPGRTPLPIWLTILIGVGSFLLAGLVIHNSLILAIVVGAVIAALLIVVVGRLGARNSRV